MCASASQSSSTPTLTLVVGHPRPNIFPGRGRQISSPYLPLLEQRRATLGVYDRHLCLAEYVPWTTTLLSSQAYTDVAARSAWAKRWPREIALEEQCRCDGEDSAAAYRQEFMILQETLKYSSH